MTRDQQEIAELLKGLGRPIEAIAANAQLPIATIKAWSASGKWPTVDRQRTLFDAGPVPEKARNP